MTTENQAAEERVKGIDAVTRVVDACERIALERDAAQERERVLAALLQGIADVDLTGGNWTPAQLYDLVKQVQQVLTPEPKPCKDWRHTTSLLTGVWTLEDGTKKDFGPQHIIACPTCQPAGSEYKVFCGGCGFEHKSGYVDCVYMKEI